ncbi:O-antigen polymerase [Acinetobacter sp. YZS-X1-1]|uniref:O-antigen polymerase n=1 Tax=Acinetobacter sp. YZS-X1-1 TaxID=1501691 RepID=UPI00054CAC51|nr:O-antigen polymerase [Acinetobacter sp. YZS-X1-1]
MLNLSYRRIFNIFLIFSYTVILFIYNIFDSDLKGYISTVVFNLFFLFFLFMCKDKIIFYFLMLLYFLMFNLCVFVGYNDLYLNIVSNSIFSYFILPIMCLSLLLPLILINRPNLQKIIDSHLTFYICLFLGIFGLISLIYLLPYSTTALLQGAKDVRTSLQETNVLPTGALTTFSVGISMFYPLFIFLIFYGFVKKINKFIIFLLFIGLLSGLVGGIVFAARDRFLWIPFFLLVNFWIWYPYLTQELKLKFKYSFIGFGILSLFFLILFTLNRFSGSHTGIWGSILAYFGAQPYIFAETVEQHNDALFYGLDLRFPFFLELLGLDVNLVTRDTPYQWMFGTLFSDFYMMGGWKYCLLFIFLLNIFYVGIYKYTKNQPWIFVLFFLLHMQILTQGIFYFSLGFPGGNLYILLTIILAILFNFINKVKL